MLRRTKVLLTRSAKRLLAIDGVIHAYFMERFPKVIRWTDAILEWLFGVFSHGAFALIIGLLLAVFVLTDKIPMLVGVCVGFSWLVAFIWIARAKFIKTLTVLARLFVVTVIGSVLAICATTFGGWILNNTEHAQEVKASVPPDKQNLDENLVRELDDMFGSRDETALRQYFGFQEMLAINIAFNTARIRYFAKTGSTEMSLTPFLVGGRDMQFSLAYDLNSIHREPGSLKATLDINSASILILSRDYSVHKAALLKYENASQLPPSVTFAVKEFDRTLQMNVDVMQNLLNDMMRRDHNYFLRNGDVSDPKYHTVIDAIFWSRFNQLRPIADQIRDGLRKAEGNN